MTDTTTQEEDLTTHVEQAKSLKIKAQEADVRFIKAVDGREGRRWLTDKRKHGADLKDVL